MRGTHVPRLFSSAMKAMSIGDALWTAGTTLWQEPPNAENRPQPKPGAISFPDTKEVFPARHFVGIGDIDVKTKLDDAVTVIALELYYAAGDCRDGDLRARLVALAKALAALAERLG